MEQHFELNKPKKEIVSGQAIQSFIQDLEQYDYEHSSSRKMGGFLAAMMMGHMDNGEGAKDIAKEITNSVTAQEIFERNIDTLQKIGLDLESPNTKGDIDLNEQLVSGEIRVNLLDKDQYVDFLKSLAPESLSDAHKKLLGMITSKISGQISHVYELENEQGDERLMEIFSGLREIVSEYERLGLVKEVELFKDYLDYMNSGYLKEYILVKNNNVFGEIGTGFNLSTFQRDAGYDYYINYWDRKFFDVLHEVRKNPNAKELEEKMIKHAKESIAFAEHDPKLENYALDDNMKAYVANVRPAIAEVKARLENI